MSSSLVLREKKHILEFHTACIRDDTIKTIGGRIIVTLLQSILSSSQPYMNC